MTPKISIDLTVGQAARHCRVSPSTIRSCMDRGYLKHYRVPGSKHRRIPRKWLKEFSDKYNVPLVDFDD